MALTENIPPNTITAVQELSSHQTPLKQEDEQTACETPLSSPEFQSPIVTRRMKKDLENVIKKDREEQPDAKGEDSDTQETEVSNEDEEDYSNWPMEGIKDPSTNDVLYGRGGG
jgi:hypothetical protein